MRLIDGATEAQIAANDQIIFLESPEYISSIDKYLISEHNNTTMKYIDPVTLAFSASTIVLPNSNESMFFGYYVPALDLLFANTQEISDRKRVRVINPTTSTIVGVLTGANVGVFHWGIEQFVYNSCTNELWLNDDIGYLSFDTATFAQLTFDAMSQSDCLAFSTVTGLIYVGCVHQRNPDNNLTLI